MLVSDISYRKNNVKFQWWNIGNFAINPAHGCAVWKYNCKWWQLLVRDLRMSHPSFDICKINFSDWVNLNVGQWHIISHKRCKIPEMKHLAFCYKPCCECFVWEYNCKWVTAIGERFKDVTSHMFPPHNIGGAGNLLQQAGGYGHLLKVRPLCRPLSSGS